jgi:predicted transcriptional regulator
MEVLKMRHSVTVRLPTDLAMWLAKTAVESGRSQAYIVRRELERARNQTNQNFMRLAGIVSAASNLSQRKVFGIPAKNHR